MTRILSLLAVSAVALFTASCGCPKPIEAPPLRPMPVFEELPSADAIGETPVVPTK